MSGLRRADTAGAPRAGRRPLRELDAATREAIGSADDDIDRDAVTAAWEAAGAGDPAADLGGDAHPLLPRDHPGMAALGRRTVGQVLADLRARGGDAAGPGPSARSTW